MDFPDVVNMFVTNMVVSCFDSFCLFAQQAKKSAFMLIGIHLVMVSDWWILPQKGARSVLIFLEYVLSLARLALSLSEAGSAWCRKAMSLIFSSTKVDFI